MNELTADDLEEQLDEFGKLTNDFQMKHGFGIDSMVRLLEETLVIKKYELDEEALAIIMKATRIKYG